MKSVYNLEAEPLKDFNQLLCQKKTLLCSYYVPGVVLDAGVRVVDKTPPSSLYSDGVEVLGNRQIKKLRK